MDQEELFILHSDRPLSKEQAEAIEKAVAAIGPIHLAGMGLKSVQDKTAKLIEIGIEKIEQAEKEFESKLEDDRPADPLRIKRLEEELAAVAAERDEWRRLNDFHKSEVEKGNRFREKLKETIASLHQRLHSKNDQIETNNRRIDELEIDLQRANRVIDYMTRKKEC